MPRVRLWTWWDGPQGPVPPGEIVEVAAEDAAALCQAGRAEVLGGDIELATVGPPEAAVAPRHSHSRRRRKSR